MTDQERNQRRNQNSYQRSENEWNERPTVDNAVNGNNGDNNWTTHLSPRLWLQHHCLYFKMYWATDHPLFPPIQCTSTMGHLLFPSMVLCTANSFNNPPL